MKPKSLTLTVSESIGTVSCLLLQPDNMKALLTLAHGAGAGMQHAFMSSLASNLAGRGIGTMRFNFPFAENKKGRPDPAPVAEKTVGAALAKAKTIADVPVFASGKSFGGRMSSRYLSANPDDAISGLIFYGFPLHPAGSPGVERADHLKAIAIPMLFLQGTRDALAEKGLIEGVCAQLKTATLSLLEGADHSFKSGKKDFIDVLAGETEAWIDSVLAKAKRK